MKANPKGEGLPNIRELAPSQGVVEDAEAGIRYLRVLPDVRRDRMGVVGFCWGGGMAFITATQARDLKAVVVYYGASPSPLDLVKDIRAPIVTITVKKTRTSTRHSGHRSGDEEIQQSLRLQDLSGRAAHLTTTRT